MKEMPEMETILIEKADYLIKNSDEVIKDGSLIIDGGEIAWVGRHGEVGVEDFDIDKKIDGSGKIVSPGLVQIHVHLLQTLFRGVADDLELLDWLNERVLPMEAKISEKGIYYSSLLGLLELIKSGVTSILDFGSVRHQDKVFQAMYESGIRGGSGKIIIDREDSAPEPMIDSTEKALNESIELLKRWDGEDNRLKYFFTPRFVPSCTEEALVRSAKLSKEHNVGLHSHAAENRGEVDLVKDITGKDNVEYLDDIGFLYDSTVLAHCIWLSEEEREMLKNTGTTVAHCPSSNLKLASGIAKIPEMLDMGINVSLGSDGAPCNNNLDIFEDMRRASLIQKGRLLDPTTMNSKETFEMATIKGAEALNLEDEIGKLEQGRKGDVAIMDLNSSHLRPFTDYQNPVSGLMYAAKDSNVTHTIVDGRVLYEEGEFLSLDEDEILKKANEEAQSLYEDVLD